MTPAAAAAYMGASLAEIAAVADHAHGSLITHRDGTAYVYVNSDTPDAAGKTGLMLLQVPQVLGYIPIFPVFTPLAMPDVSQTTPDGQPAADQPVANVSVEAIGA